MNLQAARNELGGRVPRIVGLALVVEVVLLVGLSYALVGVFA
jgi:hypothetical protein